MRVQDIPLIAVIKIVGVLYLKLGDVESEFIVLNSKHNFDPFLESNLKLPFILRDRQCRLPRSGP